MRLLFCSLPRSTPSGEREERNEVDGLYLFQLASFVPLLHKEESTEEECIFIHRSGELRKDKVVLGFFFWTSTV